MKKLIDETIILRYVLDDDKRLHERAVELIQSTDVYTYPEIFTRVAVTLRDAYRVPRSQIAYTLNLLLEDIFVVDQDVVRYANKLFGSTIMDYIDCMLVARNVVRNEDVVSFEKPLVARMFHDPSN